MELLIKERVMKSLERSILNLNLLSIKNDIKKYRVKPYLTLSTGICCFFLSGFAVAGFESQAGSESNTEMSVPYGFHQSLEDQVIAKEILGPGEKNNQNINQIIVIENTEGDQINLEDQMVTKEIMFPEANKGENQIVVKENIEGSQINLEDLMATKEIQMTDESSITAIEKEMIEKGMIDKEMVAKNNSNTKDNSIPKNIKDSASSQNNKDVANSLNNKDSGNITNIKESSTSFNIKDANNGTKNTSSNLNRNEIEPNDKVKQFLSAEKKNLSSSFPYRLNLFKNGEINQNKAGIRIAESAKQFDDLGLSGLLFFYKLYDHSMRVPHWHANAVEVGVVLNGKMKITIWDGNGTAKIFTVEKNGTWLIPQATLHALENVGHEELDFIVSYNSSNAADRDFATAWAALPDAFLEKSLNLSQKDIDTLKKTTNNRLSLFDPSSVPEKQDIASPLSGNFAQIKPIFDSPLGIIKRMDAATNPDMREMAIQQTYINPGNMREPHWYLGGDTLLFVKKGQAFFTMMDSVGKVYNAMVEPGDLIFIPVGTFHAYVNTGTDALEIYEVFNKSEGLSEITLLSGAQQFSAGTLSSATGLKKEVTEKLLRENRPSYIIPF